MDGVTCATKAGFKSERFNNTHPSPEKEIKSLEKKQIDRRSHLQRTAGKEIGILTHLHTFKRILNE